MHDIVFLAVVLLFFAAAVALVAGCAWIVSVAESSDEVGR